MDHGSGHDLLMWAAAGLLVGGGVIVIALSLLARRAPAPPRPSLDATPAPQVGSLLTVMAVALAVASALIHLAAAPSHIEELGAIGWGFVGATIFQASWALAYAIAPSRSVAAWGIAGSLAIALAWVWSRTVGLPVGPFAGAPEPVGLPDVVATLFEVMLVALLVTRLTSERRLTEWLARAPSLPVIAGVPAVGLVVVATSLAVVLAVGHTHTPGEGHASDVPGVSAEPAH